MLRQKCGRTQRKNRAAAWEIFPHRDSHQVAHLTPIAIKHMAEVLADALA